MGLIDTSSPMKWGVVKIISVLLCILIIIGVFLPWFWVEGKIQALDYEKTEHYDSIGINDYPASYPIIFSSLFCLFFIFFNYDINININRPRRVNELFPIMFAFLVFVYCVSLASKINEEISKYTSNYPTSAGGSITVLGKTYSAEASISGGVGSGFILIAVSSLLLMIFSFLLWKQKSQGAALTSAPSQEYSSTSKIEKTSATTALSREEIITAFSKIPGITVKKALSLYNAGYRSFSDLRTASPDKLLSIRGITSKDVENIKEEIEF